MKFYFAGGLLGNNWVTMLKKSNVQRGLMSFYDLTGDSPYTRTQKLEELSYWKNKDLFLDSGAYSAFNSGVKISIDEYINFINENEIEVYSNLDVIGDEKKTLLNQVYMEEMGCSPIPCFHIGENFKQFHDYLNRYSYVSLGLAKTQGSKQGENFLNQCFQIIKKYFPVKIHGFGISSQRYLERYPFYSVDSTSAIMGGGLGRVNYWDKGKLKSGAYRKKQIGERLFNCVDNGSTQHLNRRINNIIAFQKLEKYITKLWKKRGVIWDE